MSPSTFVKDQFRNDSGGVAGAIVLENGQSKSVPVQPGDTIWLSEDEQAMTANAPRHEQDNPFINGTFTLMAEARHIRHARPLRPAEETGAPPLAVGDPEQGTRPPGEEVGTPDAIPSEPQPEPENPPTEVAADGRTVVRRKNPAA
jgi:hypothetical protein